MNTRHGFGEQRQELRKLRIEDEVQFGQSAEVVRIAVELAQVRNTQPEEELEHAWKLIAAAREIVAPLLSAEERAMHEVIKSGGSQEALAQLLEARGKAQMIPYEDLISNTTPAGQPTQIVNPFWHENSGPDQPRTSTWRKLTLEGFHEAVERFVTHQSALTRRQIDSELAQQKRLTTWFQHGPTLLTLLNSIETVCADVPYVVRYAKDARQGVIKAQKYSHLALRAERIVFRIIRNANLHESEERRKRLLNEWEEISATRWKDMIILTLNAEGGLPSTLVWRIDESRRRGASERSRRGAKTRQLKSSKERTT